MQYSCGKSSYNGNLEPCRKATRDGTEDERLCIFVHPLTAPCPVRWPPCRHGARFWLEEQCVVTLCGSLSLTIRSQSTPAAPMTSSSSGEGWSREAELCIPTLVLFRERFSGKDIPGGASPGYNTGNPCIGFSLTVVVVAALVTAEAEAAMSDGSPAATNLGRPKLGLSLVGVSGLVESTSGVDGLLLRHLQRNSFIQLLCPLSFEDSTRWEMALTYRPALTWAMENKHYIHYSKKVSSPFTKYLTASLPLRLCQSHPLICVASPQVKTDFRT